MSALPLRPFAPSRSPRLAVDFDARRLAGGFAFSFRLTGRPGNLVLSALQPPPERRRADELWRRTCFEFFAGPRDAPRYLECNLAPSGDWNVYTFTGYRTGMQPCGGDLTLTLDHAGDVWTGELQGTALSGFLGPGPVVMGASVVLEYSEGACEYWALAHAAAKPDFHRRESFVLTL